VSIDARQTIEAVYRAEAPRVLATLIRLLGGFERAEEALHDAWVAALDAWPRTGVPANPRAWLVSAGRFRAIDRIRREARFAAATDELVHRIPKASRTTGCASSSPVATRRCRRTRRWR
jgi:RNA polymerase sigma-70 factor (ECF subfamily)